MRRNRNITTYEIWDATKTVAYFDSVSDLLNYVSDHPNHDDWLIVGMDGSGYTVDSFSVPDVLAGVLGREKYLRRR